VSLDDAPRDELDVAIGREAAVLREHLAKFTDTNIEWQEFEAGPAGARVTSATPPTRRRWLGAIAAGAVAATIATLVVVQTIRHDTPTQRPDVTTPTTSPTTALPTTVPPTTVLPTTTVTPAEPDRTGLLRTGPFDVLTVSVVDEVGREGVDVVVEAPDGAARLVRHVENSELPDGWTLGAAGSVSSTGWLALGAQSPDEFGWVFVDLLSADRPPRLVSGITDGGRWGPTDLFALSLNGGRPAVIDPLTGDVREIPNAKFPGGSPDIIWSADGEGFLASEGGSFGGISEVDGSSDIQPRTWRLTPLDGSADRPGVPELDPFGTTRYVTEGGSWLTVGACSSVLDMCLPNGQLMDGTLQNQVVVADAEGNSTAWYDDDLPGARLMQSSFSFDGSSIWLLLERTGASGAELVLAQVSTPRELEIRATLPIADPLPDVTVSGGGTEVRFFASFWLSPDDKLAVISTVRVEAETPVVDNQLIRTDGSASRVPIVEGMVGYLPTSVAELLAP
jgi:hypothetical protein